MMNSIVGLLVVSLLTGDVLTSEWKYHDEEHWSPFCNEGRHQSPIALSKAIAVEKEYTSFIMENYGQQSLAYLKNNGHSAEVRPKITQNKPEVKGGGLPEIYELDHLHFHWQSEHTMDGFRFPLELHLVHYAKIYGNLSEALKHPQGVAVFAVLFDLSPDDDDDFRPLLDIIDNLKDRVGEPRAIDDFVVKNFLPRDKAGYYRYDGSLTTPGCNEVVVWTVFTNTIPISRSQVKVFEKIKTMDKTELKQNFRSLQSLNDRTVYLRVSPIRSSTCINQISLYLLFSCSFLFYSLVL